MRGTDTAYAPTWLPYSLCCSVAMRGAVLRWGMVGPGYMECGAEMGIEMGYAGTWHCGVQYWYLAVLSAVLRWGMLVPGIVECSTEMGYDGTETAYGGRRLRRLRS
eukprot:1757309-Rhodomonas_salina.2